jgi:methylmalonyl-CoA mutase
MGRVAQHTARAMFARNFFEAGGIEALSNDGFDTPEAAAEAFSRSGARLAVICGSDPQYEDSGEAMARTLKGSGAERVILAGRPGEREAAIREAGVDEFIFLGCDVLGSLRAALTHLGVIKP